MFVIFVVELANGIRAKVQRIATAGYLVELGARAWIIHVAIGAEQSLLYCVVCFSVVKTEKFVYGYPATIGKPANRLDPQLRCFTLPRNGQHFGMCLRVIAFCQCSQDLSTNFRRALRVKESNQFSKRGAVFLLAQIANC